MQVVLCATASAGPVPFFNLGNVFRGPIQQARVEQGAEDSYQAPEAGYGAPEESYGAPESQCLCQQQEKKEEGKKHDVFGFIGAGLGAIGNVLISADAGVSAISSLFKPRVEPDDSYGVPKDAYGAPQNSYEVPQDSYEVPQDSYEVPEDSYGAPVENPCVCPTAEYGAPLAAPQATSYEAPEPVDAAPVSVYESLEPSYEAPEPSYEAPEPSYEAPEPTYDAPEPSYEAPDPAYSAPLYREETTQKPSYAAPEASYEIPEASYESPLTTVTLPVDSPHVILDVRQHHHHA